VSALRARFGEDAASLVTALNQGAHGGVGAGAASRLPQRTESFLHQLAEVR
jgi:hypothetical protein